ncbi:SMP-30/gluconolactonase/LRE family protein [Heyndrickxia camelliae]|uniref:SMP-30/gluconolaconase/LRE domain protein n=1 Tax=Heyndrickxia camelliae TaxID=1707093 RepID=A0A2N3LPB7_9BACI|nr:SMP-30/gluconolactonase/LRE family protein [Heyndrickxia camelliae]PKR86425.1 SMP-30/gluconolaconase/LRE domain protein [Heyndrickxia camelliae]
MSEELELIADVQSLIGEGPSWDAKNNCLYWVDIVGRKIYTFYPDTNNITQMDTEKYVGCVVPKEDGGIVVAMQDGFYSKENGNDEFTLLAGPPNYDPFTFRFNDGKCDKNGRFWAGTTSFFEESTQAKLYCLDNNLSVREALGNIIVSNGLGWSPDNKVMYYIDSPKREIYAFDYDLKSGSISNQRVVIDFHSQNANPDGMTVDEEGMLWIAHWGGHEVSRWDPAKGVKIDSIPVPVSKVTSCVFGGKELNELYITTARIGMDELQLKEEPLAGALFKIKLNVKGVPTYRFRG